MVVLRCFSKNTALILAVLFFMVSCVGTGGYVQEQRDNRVKAKEITSNLKSVSALVAPSLVVASDAATQLKQEPVVMPEVADIIERLSGHPLAMWRTDIQGYTFFVGDVLKAEYSGNSDVLKVATDDENAAGHLQCTYTAEGKRQIEPKENVRKMDKACDSLLVILHRVLTR